MAGIYWNQTEGLISLSSNGSTWITIADKNLGATEVYEDGDIMSETNCGKFYQRGNNYGFPFTGATTTSSSSVNTTGYGPGNYYSSSTFITKSSAPLTWDSNYNRNLRGGGNDSASNNWGLDTIESTKLDRRGPCNEGYHVPCGGETDNLLVVAADILGITLESSSSGGHQFFVPQSAPEKLNLLLNSLKIAKSGSINYANGYHDINSIYYGMWSSSRKENNSPSTINSFCCAESTNNRYIFYTQTTVTAIGFTIRPFKNTPVVPDYNDTWETLYGDELPDRPIPPEPPKPKLKWFIKGVNYYYFGYKPTHTSGITLNKSSIKLNNAGDTEQLIATITPEDAVNKKVLWSSSDETVATVSSTGLVTCITPGSCTITCTAVDGGVSTSCSVSKQTIIDFLLVAGGGGGGGNIECGGGGGGGGGIVICCGYTISSITNVIIGGGGVGGGRNVAGCSGGNSCFDDIIAYGGGGGGGRNTAGSSGGSGGGGGNGNYSGGAGCDGQGYSGGKGGCYSGGGGGGAGGAGNNGGTYYEGGNGGVGLQNNMSGENCYYSGWGGGGGYTSCARGNGGIGGGGRGGDARYGTLNGCPATYYGGGGGGGTCEGGRGYQGIAIVRYPTACGYDITGGCKYTCGDYTIHCFTSDGTLTVN